MRAHIRTALLALGAVAALIACSTQTPQTPAETAASGNPPNQETSETPIPPPAPARVGTTPPASDPAPTGADTTPVPMPKPMPQAAQRRKPPPQISEPLPPKPMPQAAKLDRSCRTDADCTVKNVGNCCGAFPSCVNVGSPTDPAAVQAQCAQSGMSSVCGFKEISGCHCVQGQCQDVADGPVAQ